MQAQLPSHSSQPTLLVVDELPFIEDREEQVLEFSRVLKRALLRATAPIIVLITAEHEKGVELTRLFGRELLSDPRVGHIMMNPVAQTYLVKAINRVLTLEEKETLELISLMSRIDKDSSDESAASTEAGAATAHSPISSRQGRAMLLQRLERTREQLRLLSRPQTVRALAALADGDLRAALHAMQFESIPQLCLDDAEDQKGGVSGKGAQGDEGVGAGDNGGDDNMVVRIDGRADETKVSEDCVIIDAKGAMSSTRSKRKAVALEDDAGYMDFFSVESAQRKHIAVDSSIADGGTGPRSKSLLRTSSSSTSSTLSSATSTGSGLGDRITAGKDDTYSLFHALGKVLHCKREVPFEDVVERSGLEPALFTSFLQHNYAVYFQDVEGTLSAYENVQRQIGRDCLHFFLSDCAHNPSVLHVQVSVYPIPSSSHECFLLPFFFAFQVFLLLRTRFPTRPFWVRLRAPCPSAIPSAPRHLCTQPRWLLAVT